MKYSLGISSFLEEISTIFHSIVFLSFFALITEESFLISPYYSLELCIQMDIFFFFSFTFWFFFFSAICKAFETTNLAFCISSSWGWSWSLLPAQCHKPPSIVLLTLYEIYSLESICHFNCVIIRDFIYIITEWSSDFPYFLQFKSKFGNKEFTIWAIVSSQSCFRWLNRASPSLATKNIINLISVLTIQWCPCVESSLKLLEEGICYDQYVLFKNSVSLCPASFCIPRPYLPVTSGSSYFLLLHSSPL